MPMFAIVSVVFSGSQWSAMVCDVVCDVVGRDHITAQASRQALALAVALALALALALTQSLWNWYWHWYLALPGTQPNFPVGAQVTSE